jgi:hypothetical protein
MTYAWFDQCNTPRNVVGPIRHAENEEARENVVKAVGLEACVWIGGIGHVDDVGLDVFDVGKLFANVGYGGEIEAVDLGVGEFRCDAVGHYACSAADVQGLLDVVGGEGRVDELVVHKLTNVLGLGFKSVMFDFAGEGLVIGCNDLTVKGWFTHWEGRMWSWCCGIFAHCCV